MENKCILHLCNDYSGSTVYMNLVRELDELGLTQIIYNPVREKSRINKNAIKFKTDGSKIIYRPILNYHIDRFFYPYKIDKILKDVQTEIDFSKIKYIHAHTWYSDGGVAYELSKKFNIPYIIAVRSTDINLFQKRIKYLRSYGRKILNDAKKIILISASYKKKLLVQSSLKGIKKEIEKKTQIIPNGVDPYWTLNFMKKREMHQNSTIRIIYVGTFIKRKNIIALQKAILNLSKIANIKLHLDLVGGTGADETNILNMVKMHPNIFSYHGKISEKNKLLIMLRNSDIFAMPSRNETFGLVYVEAMLQGLPVLYTAGEGIDGFYEDTIGEKVSGLANEIEIQHALFRMIENYNSYEIPITKLIDNHDWNFIANRYLALYNTL